MQAEHQALRRPNRDDSWHNQFATGAGLQISLRLVKALTGAAIAHIRIGAVGRVHDAGAQATGRGGAALFKVHVVALDCIVGAASEADWICLRSRLCWLAKNTRRGEKGCQDHKKWSHFVSPGVCCCALVMLINVGVPVSAIQFLVRIFLIDPIDGLGQPPENG
jgi:hypothetical protein